MQPNYVAEKSVAGECGGKIFLCVLLCWLIVPIIIMICLIVRTKKFRLEFYDTRVIMRRGVFNTEEQQSLLTTIVGVRINQTMGGQIFNYGDVIVDMVGRWDVDTHAIKEPNGLKKYLESLMNKQNPQKLQQFIAN